jgi:hypothetical protein
VITFILVALAEIPAEDEMFGDIVNAWSDHPHCNVVPWHTAVFRFAELVRFPILHVLEVHDAIVVEILTGKDLVLHTRGMHIRQGMLAVIPASIAKIKSADESQSVVDDNKFLVMSLASSQYER